MSFCYVKKLAWLQYLRARQSASLTAPHGPSGLESFIISCLNILHYLLFIRPLCVFFSFVAVTNFSLQSCQAFWCLMFSVPMPPCCSLHLLMCPHCPFFVHRQCQHSHSALNPVKSSEATVMGSPGSPGWWVRGAQCHLELGYHSGGTHHSHLIVTLLLGPPVFLCSGWLAQYLIVSSWVSAYVPGVCCVIHLKT